MKDYPKNIKITVSRLDSTNPFGNVPYQTSLLDTEENRDWINGIGGRQFYINGINLTGTYSVFWSRATDQICFWSKHTFPEKCTASSSAKPKKITLN